MRCPSCMAENAANRLFCAQRGLALPLSCPTCGFENEPSASFRGGCGRVVKKGETIRQVTWSPRGDEAERRHLSIMFCDLVGSTPLASRLDPEDLRDVMGAYHECVADTVATFAGFVAKYMGDGVLIYFD